MITYLPWYLWFFVLYIEKGAEDGKKALLYYLNLAFLGRCIGRSVLIRYPHMLLME